MLAPEADKKGQPMTEQSAPKDNRELREEIIDACLYLSKLGFCIGTWGNVSVRVQEGFIITPSAVNYDLLQPNDLVLVSMEGERIKGSKPPSSEMQLHRKLFINRPEFGAIVHTHSPYASSVAAAHHTIPVSVEDMAQLIGGEVRCTPYISSADHEGLANAAWETMGHDSAAVLLANHGPVVGGRTLAETVIAAQVLEKAAMMYIHANLLGCCISIPADGVKEERYRFLYKYGRDTGVGE